MAGQSSLARSAHAAFSGQDAFLHLADCSPKASEASGYLPLYGTWPSFTEHVYATAPDLQETHQD